MANALNVCNGCTKHPNSSFFIFFGFCSKNNLVMVHHGVCFVILVAFLYQLSLKAPRAHILRLQWMLQVSGIFVLETCVLHILLSVFRNSVSNWKNCYKIISLNPRQAWTAPQVYNVHETHEWYVFLGCSITNRIASPQSNIDTWFASITMRRRGKKTILMSGFVNKALDEPIMTASYLFVDISIKKHT